MKIEDVKALVDAIDFDDLPMSFVERRRVGSEWDSLRVLEDALLEAGEIDSRIIRVTRGDSTFEGKAALVYQVWQWVKDKRFETEVGASRFVFLDDMTVYMQVCHRHVGWINMPAPGR
jgi:hypothetical protein